MPHQEHSIKLDLVLPVGDVHRKMGVFYNPQMISNRNISLVLLKCWPRQQMDVADPLAGSGIRSLRFLKELPRGKIGRIFVNDKKENFPDIFQQYLRFNGLKTKDVVIGNEDAELFLLSQHTPEFCGYFDYIDIDPFGSPNPFLAAAVERIKRGGILAITATDTAALTGTYPSVTRRKYWAETVKTHLMHETGLRILIRKVQLQGVQFDKALIPILSYHKDHYFRIYFRSEKGKSRCDEVLKQHQYLLLHQKTLEFSVQRYPQKGMPVLGPLWAGNLVDQELLQDMVQNNTFPEEQKFLELLEEESKITTVGFYDLHVLARKYKKEPPKMEFALKKLNGVRTHFSLTGVKTGKGVKEVVKVLR